MTHFVCAVIVPAEVGGELTLTPTEFPTLYGDSAKEAKASESLKEYLTKALKKFDENDDVPMYVKFTKEQAIAKSRQNTEEYKNGPIYREYLADPSAYRVKYAWNKDHIDYIENEFPKMLEWTDEEHHAYFVKRYDDVDDEGNIYSTYNQHSRLDWWTIGGRWEKAYRDRQGETVRDTAAALRVFIADAQDPEEIEKLNTVYDRVQEAATRARLGEISYSDYEAVSDELLKCAAYAPWWFASHYVIPTTDDDCKEDFEWLARGRVGWFGSFTEDETELEWSKKMVARLEELPEDSQVYYLDCHI